MAKSELPPKVEKPTQWFKSTEELARIYDDIKALKGKETEGTLRPREARRLQEMKGVTRRELLKKGLLGLGLATLGVAGTKKALEYVSPREGSELPESVEWVLGFIKAYNQGKSQNDARLYFIELYNQWKKRAPASLSLPNFSQKDLELDLDELDAKFESLRQSLQKDGYFFQILPHTESVGIIIGKIIQAEKRTANKRGEKAQYQHIVIDSPRPSDSLKDSMSVDMDISAHTYRVKGVPTVLQHVDSHRRSAKAILVDIQQEPTSEKEQALQMMYGKYKRRSQKDAVAAIVQESMTSSLRHEEQHVVDGAFTGMSDMTEQKRMDVIIAELRGILSPISDESPKLAVHHIYHRWVDSKDPIRQAAGSMAKSILQDVSKRRLYQLLSTSDEELKSIGRKAMGATDILRKHIVLEKKPFKDPELKENFNNYLHQLNRNE